MSSDKSALSLLAARDRRQESLTRILSQAHPATVFVSLNIPGPEKTPAGAQAFFLSIQGELKRAFPGLSICEESCDALGPYAIIALEMDPLAAKQCCMALEAAHPAARLVDLDVYSADGEQIGRARLGLPARRCLVCPASAVDCMRLKRHAPDEIITRTHELLSLFNA